LREFIVKIKVVGINARYTHSCLALFYLRNELENHIPECSVEICQFTINDPYYTLVQRLSDGAADYLFFSAVIWNSELTVKLITDLLCISDSCRFVVGGPQARIIGSAFETSERVIVFSGDIEAADERFYRDIVSRDTVSVYEASFFSCAGRQLSYPYRTEDFSGPLRNRHIYYETSRGCPFSCTYCLSSAEKGLYHKDLKQVFSELDDILSYRPAVVRFLDRTFNDLPDRACAIWNYLKEYKSETLFHFEIAPDRFTEEMFDLLADVASGRFQFEIGIQSTNRKTLDAIKRPMAPETAEQVIKRLRSLETIHLHADLILGLPHETRESFYQSFNDVFRMKPHYIQMGLLKLLPNTEIAVQAKNSGFRSSQYPPYSVYATTWLSSVQLRELYWFCECVEKCINNRYFVSFWNYLSGLEENTALFFESLSGAFMEEGYFWKAATQETLSRLLAEQSGNRSDGALLKELLCYDWLRCGHRFVPKHLENKKASIDELRRHLFHILPAETAGEYSRKSRSNFFKKSVFFIFSRETLNHIGYEVKAPWSVVRFSSERESNVLTLHKTQVVLEIDTPLIESL